MKMKIRKYHVLPLGIALVPALQRKLASTEPPDSMYFPAFDSDVKYHSGLLSHLDEQQDTETCNVYLKLGMVSIMRTSYVLRMTNTDSMG